MKKTVKFALALSVALTLVMGSFVGVTRVDAAPAKPVNLVICSSAAGGASYYLATGLTKIVSEKIPGYTMTNESTSGSGPENGQFVTDRPEDTFGMLNTDTMKSALLGLQDRGFRKPLPDLRLAMVGHMQYVYPIVLRSSGIQGFADLKGKKIALPPKGQGAYYQMLIILESYGLKEGADYRAIAMTNAEAGDALKDGTVDCAVVSGSIPQATASDLDVTQNIHFLSLDQEHAQSIVAQYPQYGIGTIPGNSYKDEPNDTLSLTLSIVIICNATMDEEIVYNVVKTICENSEEMRVIHANGPEYSAPSSKAIYENGSLPFHPGALRYFDELWKK
ncbi:MAG: TAXI family TRAP transporter solute-binding subunit [Synergistaceae bacterium]|jgi:TRAP transporter TAXI family solute receptor|nr:TAXI family TRAP transporter solute-binding subunit [Synergistaceae bacterium]